MCFTGGRGRCRLPPATSPRRCAADRSELAVATGLGRSTVAQRVDALLASALVGPAGEATSSGGRPPTQFAFNPAARVVLAADVGATHVRLAVTDLAADVLAERARRPRHRRSVRRPCCAGSSTTAAARSPRPAASRPISPASASACPGPVEHATGRPDQPADHAGLGRLRRPGFVRRQLGVVVVVDNDVNMMALGEHFIGFRDVDHLLFVKVATGIGSGIISDGELRRGAQGAAGDLGHIQVPHDVDAVCRCGNIGCLEAVASGAAIAGTAARRGVDADVEPRRRGPRPRRLGAGDPAACARPAGRSARCWPAPSACSTRA